MRVVDTPVSDVVVKFRLRQPSEDKVNEIAESINQVGLINPITLDKHNNLLAGFHRFLAYQKLNKDTIPSIIQDRDKRYSELVEVDENLKRNELNHIETGDHIVRREELLQELGLTASSGDNRFTSSPDKLKIEDIAEGVGLSKRSYQQRKQVSKIHPEVKDLLVDTTYADSLLDLVRLSSETDEMQKAICNLLITGKCRTWKMAFYHAKLNDFKLNRQSTLDFNIKERFGDYPKSIMKFQKVEDNLKSICDLVNHDENLRVQKGELRFGETAIKLHQMNPEQCRFSIDYYTNPGDLILDPFNGRGTTALTSLSLNRKFVGYEINPISSQRTREVVKNHTDASGDEFQLIDGCGCEMKEFDGKSEFIDAVFSSPPYYMNAEPYSDDVNDLCNMEIEEFDKKIDVMFSNLSRVIKRSNYKEKIFHPVMMVVGTARKADMGIQDMSFTFQAIAKRHGFTLWDQMFVELNNPFLVCSIKRNYEFKFVHKNYESQLCWVKF